MPTYHLANVVDDHLMGITHVIRGEEWLPSAPLHVMLYKFLDWESTMPVFAHLPLILKPEGNGKLSKRDGDKLGFPVFPLEWKDPKSGEISSGYRESGYRPDAVLNLLALLGWHPSDNREMFTLDELCQEFSLDRVSKSGAKFDQNKAKWFNHQYILKAPISDLTDKVMEDAETRFPGTERNYVQKVVELMREKVNFTTEILDAGSFFFTEPESYDDKVVRKKWKNDIPQMISELSSAFNDLGNWSADEIQSCFSSFAESKDKSAGSLMQPLRVSVSGEGGGPPIFEMLEVLGKETVVSRMQNAVETLPQATA